MFFIKDIDPIQENQRLNALYRYNIIDTPSEEAFDRITRVARTALNAPIALMTLIDRDRQWFKSKQGTKIQETGRDVSFCTYTIQNDEPLVVPDLKKDIRFADNPFVKGLPFLRFYCGVPLKTKDGYNIGSLCILDRKPRKLKTDELAMIVDLARLAIDEVETRNMTKVDYLTGIATRRALFDQGDNEMKQMKVNGGLLSAIGFSVDHYKKIGEKYGQHAGEAVLKACVETCKPLLRPTDVFARIGNEDFAVLMPKTSLEEAQKIAGHLAMAIGAMQVPFAKALIKTTCSYGVTTYFPGDKDFGQLLSRSFAALLRAKRGGKERVAVIDPVTDPSCLSGACVEAVAQL